MTDLDTDMSDYVDLQRYPVLYPYAEVDTTTQGMGALPDWINGTVTASVNQWAVLSGTYKLGGIKAENLDIDRVIMVDCGPGWLHQLFKVTHLSPSLEGIQVDGVQVGGYFLNKNPVRKELQFPVASPNAAWKLIQDNLEDPHPELSFDSDVSTTADVDFPAATNASNLLLDADQEGDKATESIPGLYGGEVWADNFNIHHREHMGRYRNFVIKYGKDIRTLDQDKNIEDTYTGCFFHAEYQPGQPKANLNNVNWAGYQGSWSSIGTVTFAVNGQVPVYDAPVAGHHQIWALSRGTKIKVGKILNNGDMVPDLEKPNVQLEVDTVYGDSWYPLSDGGWIDAKWVTFSKSGDYLVSNAQGYGTVDLTNISSKGTKFPVKGSAVVTYLGNGDKIHIYYSPFQGPDHYRRKTSSGSYETLTNGQTIKFEMEAIDENGHPWYMIGSHKWVYGPHLSLSKSNASATYPAYGYGYVKKGAQKYVINKKHKIVPAAKHTVIVSTKGKKTKKGSYVRRKINGKEKKVFKLNASYVEAKKKKVKTTVKSGYAHIHSQVVMGGTTYYKVDHGILVKSSDFDWKRKKAVQPKTPKQIETNSAIKDGKIEIYAEPTTNSAVNWSVDTGAKLKIQQTAKGADGQDWDYVTYAGKSGWILNKFMNYSADDAFSPVTPEDTSEGDDTDELSSDVDDQQVRVELPEGALIADNWIGREAQNIEDVDLSAYIVHDDTDLSGQQPDGSFIATEDDIKQLRAAAQDYMIEHRIGQVPVSLTIDYVQMRNIFGDLQDIRLGDTVGVQFDPANIRQNAEVTTTVWNFVAKHYDSITIGDPPKTYEHLLKESVKQDTEALKRSTNAKVGNALSLMGQINSAVQSEGASRTEQFTKLWTELGNTNITVKANGRTITQQGEKLSDFEKHMTQMATDVDNFNNWLETGPRSTLHFVNDSGQEDFKNPTEIRAGSDNGPYFALNSNGIAYRSAGGQPYALFGVDESTGEVKGNFYVDEAHIPTLDASHIETDTIHSLGTINGNLTVTNDYMTVEVGNINNTSVGDASQGGIGISSPNYDSAYSSGSIWISDHDGDHTYIGPNTASVGGRSVLVTSSSTYIMGDWIKKYWQGPSKYWNL